MNDALLVGLFQRFRDLFRDGKALIQGQGSLREAIGERRAFHELHDEGVRFAARLHAVDLGDVRVIELREQLRLALESREALPVLR